MRLTRPLFADSASGKVGDIGHIRATSAGFFFIKQSGIEKKTTQAELDNRATFASHYAAFTAAGFRLNASWRVWIHNATVAPPVNRGALASGKILNTPKREAPAGATRGNLATGSVLIPARTTTIAPVNRGALSTGRLLTAIRK